MIRIGTSGYSYDDWVGPYYPPQLSKSEWLTFYAHEFDTTELNFSYYRQPDAPMLERMAAKVPPGFLFTIKAFQGLTHERAEDNAAEFETFVEGLAPLIDVGKFGCVLAQFPFSFHATPENLDYLKLCRERFGDLAVVVEFRNREWLTPAIWQLLREQRLGFCCVDEPHFKSLMPPIAEATGPIAYVRFHGRNAQKWWKHEQAYERYDYAYSDEELREWVPKIEKLAAESQTTFVFANNHFQGKAITTAQQLRMLLGGEGQGGPPSGGS
jgi:uncharacterized protein YecE (DUF72 family)